MWSSIRLRRALACSAVVLSVVLAHSWVVQILHELAHGWLTLGARDLMPERMQAIYVRSMQPEAQAPRSPQVSDRPIPARKPVPRPAAAVVAVAASAASAPQVSAVQSQAPEASQTPASAGTPASPLFDSSVDEWSAWPDPATARAPDFDWPEATRLRFKLTGNYRGDIEGGAQVEWLRQGDQYQVHLDIHVGFEAVPLMSRRMSSAGTITPGGGLMPQRYDQETRLPFSAPTRATVRMDPHVVQLANGQRRETLAGLQDTASQFVQLSWLFNTQLVHMYPGTTVTVPLALPGGVRQMVYDVRQPESLTTPFGEVPVIPLKPRYVAQAGGDMSVEMWFAPQYRYLPIRLLIRQDAETFVDLMIIEPPALAASSPDPVPAAPASQPERETP